MFYFIRIFTEELAKARLPITHLPIAADNKGINYFHIKTELLLFLIVLGLRLPCFIGAQCGAQPEKLRVKI